MSETSANLNTTSNALARGAAASLSDYLALMKPRVMSLVVFTALAGLILAPGEIEFLRGLVAMCAIAFGAGAAGALNMWYDADIDAEMERTANRPIPAGRLSRDAALGVGLGLAVASVLILGIAANWVAALLLAITIFYYAVIYTMLLKRSTPQNIVIGGAAGALPPVIGWAVKSGAIGFESIALFLIIFLWTPPHFWALSLNRMEDYARAKVPMMPVAAGTDATRRQILAYAVLTVAASFLPTLLMFAGSYYAIAAAVMGAVFVYLAYQVFAQRFGRMAASAARRLFAYSIFYLFGLFAALLLEHMLAPLAAAIPAVS